jgi:hypothetical protein
MSESVSWGWSAGRWHVEDDHLLEQDEGAEIEKVHDQNPIIIFMW